MGRKYGYGKYGYGTYDLGTTNVTFQGRATFEITLSGRMWVEKNFTGYAIHVPTHITSHEYIGPFWDPFGPGNDPWQPVTEPGEPWVPIEAVSEPWTPITEPPPMFKV